METYEDFEKFIEEMKNKEVELPKIPEVHFYTKEAFEAFHNACKEYMEFLMNKNKNGR